MEQVELEQIIEKARLDRVDNLDLRDCEISFLPESIGNLSSLTRLNLYRNKLTTLPESIHNLVNLTNLNLGCNQLTRLPESINRLTSLTSLFLIRNQLSSLPINLGNLSNLSKLCLQENNLTELPDSISNFSNLKELYLQQNTLTMLPNSMSKLNNLKEIYLSDNPWIDLSILKNIPNLKRVYCFGVSLSPCYWSYLSEWKSEWLFNEDNTEIRHVLIEQLGCEKIVGQLSLFSYDTCHQKNTKKFKLDFSNRELAVLPYDIGNLTYLTELHLRNNKLAVLPESIGDLSNLTILDLGSNQLTRLPDSITRLSKLKLIYLSNNPWTDLSSLQKVPQLESVYCFGVTLPCRYWIKLSNWKAKWLLDENNIEIRQLLIAQIGYEKICDELNAIMLDNWREYNLLKIDGIEKIYDDEDDEPVDKEPMVLLKMTCPSTQHIHILRVPPEMTSAEAAITWVNHGIHPDEFAVQT